MIDVDVKIVEKHDKILDIISRPINSITNFDWHADYPLYKESTIDADYFVKQVDPVWYEQNWPIILASKGFIKEYTWIFPHDYSDEDVKIFMSKKGECRVFNKKFDKKMEIYSEHVTIDLDFFGSKSPVIWSPEGGDSGRIKLLREVLGTLKADNIILIISKTELYVNYDINKFLQDMIIELECVANIIDISDIK